MHAGRIERGLGGGAGRVRAAARHRQRRRGSIRIPASFSGAFGRKPSYGRIPVGPHAYWIYQDTSVSGPLTKTVEDAALFLDQVVGASPWDPNSPPHRGLSYVERVRAGVPNPLRIAYSPDLGYAVVQSDVAAAVEDAVRVFARLGHRVESIAGGPPLLGRDWAMLGIFELASRLYPLLPERESDFGRSFIRAVKLGWKMTPETWGAAARQREELNAWCARVFDAYDLLVTPTVPYDPPPAGGPFPEETEGRPQVIAGVGSFTIPFNLSWHPAATVRAGLSRAKLPIGPPRTPPRCPERSSSAPHRQRGAPPRHRAPARASARALPPRWTFTTARVTGPCTP